MIELASAGALLAIGFVIFGLSTTFTRKGIQDLTESIKRLRQSVESFTDFKADSFSGRVLSDGCLEITFLKDLGQILDGKETSTSASLCPVTCGKQSLTRTARASCSAFKRISNRKTKNEEVAS